MDDATTNLTPEQEAARVELARYEDEGQLLPGSAAKLATMLHEVGSLSADRRAAEIARRVEGNGFASLKNPEYVPAKLPNGADPSPVRRVLQRYASELAGGQEAVDRLAIEWGAKLNGKSTPEIAAEVTRRLTHKSNGHLRVAPLLHQLPKSTLEFVRAATQDAPPEDAPPARPAPRRPLVR